MTLVSLAKFWQYSVRLKEEERNGWKKLGLQRVESVADHSLSLALMGLWEAERRNYDVAKVLKLAVIHDLEEALTGDLTPLDKAIRGEAEAQAEKKRAIEELIKNLPGRSRAAYRRLWSDLLLRRTKEARLVDELDKLEMALQARRYANRVGSKRVKDFYVSASKGVKDPSLKRVLNSVTRGS